VRVAVDTNVLIYAHIASLPQHAAARARLHELLRDGATALVVTPQILSEFVHVITDGRRFDPPVSMAEAVAIARGYLGRENVECLSVGEAEMSRALELMERHRLGRRRLADTLLVATLLGAGVTALMTADIGDFALFEELRLIDPLAERETGQ
jgi:uncharacterized protein